MNTTDYLIAADQTGSVMNSLTQTSLRHSYDPFGQTSTLKPGRSGFNGAYLEGTIGIYLLGNGYRAYSPILRRFISPDTLSPFGQGGLNSYCYCVGDPINAVDPTGHMPTLPKIPKFRLTGIAKARNSIAKNSIIIDTYIKQFHRPLEQMGNLDSDGIAGFLIERGNQEARHVGRQFNKYATTTEGNILSEAKITENAGLHSMLNPSYITPARPKALIASDIALGTSEVPSHAGRDFLLYVLGLESAAFSNEMHLRIRQILQRHVRKNLKEPYPAWYEASRKMNEQLMPPSMKKIRRASN